MLKDNFISRALFTLYVLQNPAANWNMLERMDLTICFDTLLTELKSHTRIAYMTLYLSISKNADLHSWFLNLSKPLSKALRNMTVYGLVTPTII